MLETMDAERIAFRRHQINSRMPIRYLIILIANVAFFLIANVAFFQGSNDECQPLSNRPAIPKSNVVHFAHHT
jgi:hypothetical protein